jgi:tetratricopeptide (TPR) repeat protein
MSNTASSDVQPFWQRLGAISRYPLQSGAFLTVLLFTGLRFFEWMLPGIPGRVVGLFLWMGVLKYAVEALVQTAHGQLEAPDFTRSVSESQAWNQIKLQILLWLMLFVGVLLFGVLLGPIGALAWGAFVVLAMPGATITLALTDNLWASLNPSGWIELMSAFGWPYFAVALLCGVYQLSGANAQAFALPFLPGVVGYLFAWFITHYVLIATFHLMGYLVLQYADRVGHEVKRDAAPAKLRNLRADPDQGLVDEAQALVQDGRPDEAAAMLREHIASRGATPLLHDHYRTLLKAQQDQAQLLSHAQVYVPVLLAQDNLKRALEVLQEVFALDPAFSADIADDTHRLANRATQLGQHQLALKLIAGFHKRWPKHKDIARNYLLAAKILTDKLNREDQAAQLLTQLKAFRPDDPLMPEIDAQLAFLASLARTSKVGAPSA